MDHISTVFLPIIPPEMRPKIRIIGKEESKELLEQLLA
jgi:DNA-directed RNA polymerase beta' subunit